MAGYVNKVILLGNVGRDTEIRFAQDGSKVAILSVATSDYWKDRVTGEAKERTEWHRVVVFQPHLIDVCEKFLRAGSKVYLEGQLQTRKWSDANTGVEKRSREVIIRYEGTIKIISSDNRGRSGDGAQGGGMNQMDGHGGGGMSSGGAQQAPGDIDEDHIPF